ncbi:MAG: hypothetical protein OEW15_04395 [Nitrospirota bacterium]|nr:hypothetical protein [Nitrospirota bacterium]
MSFPRTSRWSTEGTGLHQNGTVDVILDPAYAARSGSATYSMAAQTSSNIG